MKTKLLLALVAVTLLLTGCSKSHDYYFYLNGDYVKADKQKFRILFTGEVVNCYFTKNGNIYNTCDYYKRKITSYR